MTYFPQLPLCHQAGHLASTFTFHFLWQKKEILRKQAGCCAGLDSPHPPHGPVTMVVQFEFVLLNTKSNYKYVQ
jgi:hypothetical protein